MSRMNTDIIGLKPLGLETELLGADQAIARAEMLFALMSPAQKRRINRWLASKVNAWSRQRAKRARDLNEKTWEKRAAQPDKPVLTKIMDAKRLVTFADPDQATITWKNDLAGFRAALNQYGVSIEARARTKREMRALRLAGGRIAGAARMTDNQRSALLALGVAPERMAGWGWLQAGAVIKYLRRKRAGTQDQPRKTQWEIPVPARSFLGATDKERKKLLAMTNERFIRGIFRDLLTTQQPTRSNP